MSLIESSAKPQPAAMRIISHRTHGNPDQCFPTPDSNRHPADKRHDYSTLQSPRGLSDVAGLTDKTGDCIPPGLRAFAAPRIASRFSPGIPQGAWGESPPGESWSPDAYGKDGVQDYMMQRTDQGITLFKTVRGIV